MPLPYARINQLNNDAINVQTKIGIFTHSNERTELLINELIKLTAKNGKHKTHTHTLFYEKQHQKHQKSIYYCKHLINEINNNPK